MFESVGPRTRCGSMQSTTASSGENARPPEDLGGPSAYFDFLAAIKDAAHEEHNTMLQWIGGSFDPVSFNITDANERLASIKA
jgi:hypothetical protein